LVSHDVLLQEEVPAVPEAVEEPVASEPVVPSDDSVEHVPETNGSSNGNGNANGVDVVEEEEEEQVVDGKRKSEVVGEGDAPDSTEVVKKQKVVEDAVEEPVVPVVPEEPVEASV